VQGPLPTASTTAQGKRVSFNPAYNALRNPMRPITIPPSKQHQQQQQLTDEQQGAQELLSFNSSGSGPTGSEDLAEGAHIPR